MSKRTDYVGSFQAHGDRGGSRTLHVFVNIVAAGHLGDPHAERQGMPSIETEDGQPVNRLEKGTYEVVVTDEILHSDDMDAP